MASGPTGLTAAAFLRAAQTLSARLCHDVAGEAGAVAALLAPMASGKPEVVPNPEEVSLAAELALGLSARVRLLRFAFAPPGEPVSATDLQAWLGDLPVPSRVQLESAGLEGTLVLDGGMAQLALCLVMFGVASVRGTGRVRLSVEDASTLIVFIEGPRAGWPPELTLWTIDQEAAVAGMDDPRWIAGPYACLLAAEAGIRLSFLLDVAGASPPPLLAARA